MKKLALFLLAAALQAQDASRHVIIVSLDGFAQVALEDPQTSAPNLRRLAREGVMATHGMMPINPTVTWPNHTAMVTGVDATRHGVLQNGLPVRAPGRPVRVDPNAPKTTLVQATTVYDVAHAAGLTSAEADWVAVANAPTIDWSFAEVPDPSGKAVQETIASGVASAEQVARFRKLPITQRDEIWTSAALDIYRKHRPNLLMLHLLTTDSVQHAYGAGTLAARTALALADRELGRFLDGLKKDNLLDNVTLFVVSDHGFHTATKSIRPNVAVRRAGLSDTKGCQVYVMPEGGTAFVYVTDEAKRAELVPRLAGLFQGVEGIEQIITPDEYAKYGYPAAGPGSRMGELLLAAKGGYNFSDGSDGDLVVTLPSGAGTHGYLRSREDMQAIFVAWGAGIRAGAKLERLNNVDIAPTVARLLGLTMPPVSGHVLTEILK